MRLLLTIIKFFVLLHLCTAKTRQSCFSPIYCQGELLDTVQHSKVFNDSKTFVDMAMIYPVNETMKHFRAMMAETDDAPNPEQVRAFVNKNFKSVGEMEDVVPPDYKPEPKIIKDITDPVVRTFATKVISIWPTLTRKVSHQVFEHPDTFSIIPIPHRFIIPGGRFKEYYYWDTYWIVKGLLLSDMLETAQGMVENLLSMVEKFGFVPNGGRIYYLNRSQPPLLTLMVSDYVKYTNDFEFLRNNVNILEKELNFWLTKRITEIDKNGNTYILAHYDSESDTPRPESYVEDIETCQELNEDEQVRDNINVLFNITPLYKAKK